MSRAPKKCPICGSRTTWKKIDSTKKGYSVGKAAVGAVLVGPVGLLGGALGKKKSTWVCTSCQFCHEYDH